MEYKKWLISEELRDADYYKNIVLSKLDLDQQGVTQSLNVWDSNKLIKKLSELGEYTKLPEAKKKSIEARIRSKVGTINDLIRSIVS